MVKANPDLELQKPLIHRLWVKDEFNEDEPASDCFVMLHDPRCPQAGGENVCHERFIDTESGLDMFFIHSKDPEKASSYQTRLEPGVYEVEAWAQKTNAYFDPEEWDEGVNVITTPRKPDPSAALPPEEQHQLWIWLQGAKVPHWEIRGTGALI